MTKEMFKEITAWQRETFPSATALSAANHLKEEVEEMIYDLKTNSPFTPFEYADCFLLLFGSASLFGLSYEEICKYIQDKMVLNKHRKWGKPNDNGYIKHVTFKRGDVVFLKEDENREAYAVNEYTKEISTGPVGQLQPSPVVSVTDLMLRQWSFREDSLQLLIGKPDVQVSDTTKMPNEQNDNKKTTIQ